MEQHPSVSHVKILVVSYFFFRAMLTAAWYVFFMSMATVIGPTPPGTGVICPATSLTAKINEFEA